MRTGRMGRGRRVGAVVVVAACAGPGVGVAAADGFFLRYDRFIDFFDRAPIQEHPATSNPTTAIGSLSVPGASASLSQSPYEDTAAGIFFSASSAAEAGARSMIFSSEMEIGLNSFAFYPKRAGLLGEIHATAGGTNTKMTVRNGGFAREVEGSLVMPLMPQQVIVQVFGGRQTGGGGVDTAYSMAMTGSILFKVDEAISRRFHWRGTNTNDRELATSLNWVEGRAPNENIVAVFGKLNYSEQPKFAGDTAWGGLVADGGFSARLDLEGHTLSLGKASLGADDFSISVGEEQFGGSNVVVQNGTVNCEGNILIETRTVGDAGGSVPSLNISVDATVNAEGIVSVGKHSGTRGALGVFGANTRLNTLGLVLGAQGGGFASVSAGARVTLDQILQLAQGPVGGETAQLEVMGEGTFLGVGGNPGSGTSTVSIGARNKGTLAVLDGATVDFNSARVDIGLDTVASGSIVSVKGANSRLLGGTYNVGNACTLEVLDGAKLESLPSSGVAMGPGALLVADNNASVTVGNVFASFAGAGVRVTNSSSLEVGGEIRIEEGASVFVSKGSTLSGFDQVAVNGDLLVGTGSAVTGNIVAVGGAGRVIIGGGVVQVTTLIANHGRIIADGGPFIETSPDPDPGPGGGEQAAVAALAAADEVKGVVAKVEGNLVVGSGASVELDVFSAGDFDSLVVTGDLAFDGTLVLNFAGGYAPVAGVTFDLLSVTGGFAGVAAADVVVGGLEPGWQFSAGVSGGVLRVVSLSDAVAAVPEPGCLWVVVAGVVGVMGRGRRGR